MGTAPISVPPGGEVGAEVGVAGTAGKENSSFPLGIEGATAIGETLPSVRKSGGELATGGVAVALGAPGTSAVAPAREAAIARKSDSVSGLGCVDGGEAGTLGADSAEIS